MADLSVSQANEQIEHAHSVLDDLGVPRKANTFVTLTLAGRLDWLREHTRTKSGPDASNEHACLTREACWNPQHLDIDPWSESIAKGTSQ